MERYDKSLFRRIVFIYMIQSLVLSVTGIVDSAVVGRFIGAEGLAGMKLAMPVFSLQYMFGGIFSTGLTVQVSKLLAKGRRSSANQCFLWVCAAAAGISCLFMLAAVIFPDALTGIFSGNAVNPKLYENVKDYLLPVTFGTMPVIMQIILSGTAALEGAGRRLTVSIAAMLVSDIIGDLLAIALGVGIRGIAAASVFAYLCACLVLAGPLFSGKSIFRPVRLHIREGMLAPVIIAGFPAAVRFLCDFLCPMAVNRVMLRFGSISGLAALSIQDAAHYIPLALSEGIASAVILLTSTFAAEYDRAALKRERKIILRFSAAEGSLWALVIAAAAPLLVMLFAKDAPLRSMGVFALRRYLPGVPFICLNMAAASYMQGMGRQKEAGIILLINKFVFPVVFAILLGSRAHETGIFTSFAMNEIAFALVLICLTVLRRKTGNAAFGEEAWEKINAEIRDHLETLKEVTEASEKVIRMCEANGAGTAMPAASACVSKSWQSTACSTDSLTKGKKIWNTGS